jgi:hypothetical protein
VKKETKGNTWRKKETKGNTWGKKRQRETRGEKRDKGKHVAKKR